MRLISEESWLKIQFCHLMSKLHFKIYRKQLHSFVIIFHNITVFLIKQRQLLWPKETSFKTFLKKLTNTKLLNIVEI